MGCGSETIMCEREWGQVSGKIWWWITVTSSGEGLSNRAAYIWSPRLKRPLPTQRWLEDRYEIGLDGGEENILRGYRPDCWKR